MNKIKQVKLKHFKFFYDEVMLDLNRKNTLIYGENGSGKSSLYWALYTFLQSVFKAKPQDVQKYFNNSDQNLRNRFALDIDDSYIKIVFEDEEQSITEKSISNTTVNTKKGNLVKQAALGSDLINYKLLSRIHNFKNPQIVELFSLFDKEALPFINFREVLVRHDGMAATANAQDWWDYLKPGLHPRGRMHDPAYKTFQSAVAKFNDGMQFYLDSIVESVNDYLNKFGQKFMVRFEYEPCNYDGFIKGSTTRRTHRTAAPKIHLSVSLSHERLEPHNRELSRPHTFLNEAKLTAIALSIRFAMLDEKIGNLKMDDTPRILIMDDLLISLDMSNRDRVLDLILKEFTGYQLIIMTHDRAFFELVKHKISKHDQSAWNYFEMYEAEKEGIPQPLIKTSESYLEKAEKYFHQKEYEISGNFLRKEAESFCRRFLPKRHQMTADFNIQSLDGLITQAKHFASGAELDLTLFDKLDSHRKFVFNPASHDSYDVPKFNNEIASCLETMKALEEVQSETFLPRGSHVEFELVTVDGKNTYKFEIKLEDDFRLLKTPMGGSVLSKGIVNYWVSKNGIKEDLQHKVDSLKHMYDHCYEKSNKAKNEDFWESIILSKTGEKLNESRSY